MTQSNSVQHYVRTDWVAEQEPPLSSVGAVAWLRQNFFSSPLNTVLTLVGVYIIYVIVPPIFNFFVLDAYYSGTSREDCLGRAGACYPYLSARFWQFVYGFYPIDERWRVNVTFFLFVALLAGLLIPSVPRKGLNAVLFFLVFPIIAYLLLFGGGIGVPFTDIHLFDLQKVGTHQWGGVLVTMVVAVVGIVISLPLGILFALGRRSSLPIAKFVSVLFIEFWRGVPLITVLFMAKTMIPLFVVNEALRPDTLVSALIGVTLFSAAYLAEVVRGGLQAIPKGQYEGAMSLGLGYWRMMYFIILPQALKLVIPGIVNSFIALFKDTSLLLIIGVFDFLLQVQTSLRDPNWSTPYTMYTGFGFAAAFYFICCFGMSKYSMFMEKRLSYGQKR